VIECMTVDSISAPTVISAAGGGWNSRRAARCSEQLGFGRISNFSRNFGRCTPPGRPRRTPNSVLLMVEPQLQLGVEFHPRTTTVSVEEKAGLESVVSRGCGRASVTVTLARFVLPQHRPCHVVHQRA
jgi:hypothetical protein